MSSQSPSWLTAKAEFTKWASLALPAALTIMFSCSLTLTDASVLGHLRTDLHYLHYPNATSTEFLSAVSLGYSWSYALNIFIFGGTSNAISVLSSQAFGAKNYARGTQVYWAGLLCSVVIAVPIGVGVYFTADVVKFILPDTTTDLRYTLIQDFSHIMLFALPGQTLRSCTSNFLNSANVVKGPLVISIFAAFLNLVFNECFVYGFLPLGIKAIGFRGSPCATAATSTIGSMLVFFYLVFGAGSSEHVHVSKHMRDNLCCRRNKSTMPGSSESSSSLTSELLPPLVDESDAGDSITTKSSRGSCFDRELLVAYVSQAMPLSLGAAFEEWQIQVVSFFAGALGPVSTATNNGVMQIFVTISALNYGIMTATTVRVGFYMGEGEPRKAKSVVIIALVTSVVVGAAIGLSFVALRNWMGLLYSNDPKVVELSSSLCWIVGPTYICLSVFFVSVATLQGQGRSGILAACFLIGAWVVSVPAAWVLTFDFNMDLIGIWLGLVAGYAVIMFLTAIALYKSDWEKISNEAVKENKEKEK
jgi:Na+-driven multidrug efflux pump